MTYPLHSVEPISLLEVRPEFYVYRFYDAAGVLLYVGSTGDPFTRWQQHRRRSPWAGDVATVELDAFTYEAVAQDAEYTAILTERPSHNVKVTGLGYGLTLADLDQPRSTDRSTDSPTDHSENPTDGRTDGRTGEALPLQPAHGTYVTRGRHR